MTIGWGIGDWGGVGGTDDTTGAALDGTPWGGVGDADLSAPSFDGVTSPLGPSLVSGSVLVDVLGGDVLRLVGAEFEEDMVVEVLSGSAGSYVTEGTCFMFDPRYDLTATRAFVGSPAIAVGLYHLRITTTAGVVVLEDCLDYRNISMQLKIERVRMGLAKAWESGPRYLSGGV